MRQYTEMMMQCRYTHASELSQIFHAHRLRVVVSDPGDRSRGTMALISRGCNGSKASAFRSTQKPVNDLALNEAAQKWNILRVREQIQQPAAGAQQFDRDHASNHRRRFSRQLGNVDFFPAEKLTDYRHLQFESQGQHGFCRTCFDHLANDRQVDRGQKESRPVENEGGLAQVDALAALGDDDHAWRIPSRAW